ncbi:uncharacterized protein LOC125719880 [Brienomyrus brachyistius]|uniref:uncharacterized protein LOC125719880 n=1 Tax=Brienomyrus brachyistius TaxID=42636 RepID=UPI0020B2F301|nr:uncharacterized protein LOC125719880 [Brienomyrus brachyistius]
MSLLAIAGLLWSLCLWSCLGSSEIQVTCVFSEVCVLPCQFTRGKDEVIHWYKGTAVVHSYYDNMDQLAQQDPAYKNRTSMDKEQVAKGNASLSLWRTNLQDGGKYRCYCSTAQSQESFVVVEVKGNHGGSTKGSSLWALLPLGPVAIIIILPCIIKRQQIRDSLRMRCQGKQAGNRASRNTENRLEGLELNSDPVTQNPNNLSLSTGSPQGCVLGPLLFTLYTHDCVPAHLSKSIITFADDTTVVGLISGGDESAYHDEVERPNSREGRKVYETDGFMQVVCVCRDLQDVDREAGVGANKEGEARMWATEKHNISDGTEPPLTGSHLNKEIQVTCVFSEVCVLPCQFTRGKDAVIHWYKGTAVVHSFYYNKDQLAQQDPAYKNRTSMDREQVAKGNASLSLWRTNLQDRGKYRCYCSTTQSQESFFVVEVKALVRSVDMKVLGEEVHCSSQNIYPKPHVSWETDPPTNSEALQATTESLPDSVGLFTLESRVGILGNRSDYTYICSISLEGASQLWTASLKHQDIIEGVEGQALSIPCHAPNDLQNFTLTWAFMTTGQPTVFLSFSSQTGKVANNWGDRVQLDPAQAQSGNGSLQLQNLQDQEMNGTFICTFSKEYSRHTVYTSVRVTGAGNQGHEWLWPVLAVAFIAAFIILPCIIWRYFRQQIRDSFRMRCQGRQAGNRASRNTENQQNQPEEELELTSDPGREVDNEASRNTENQQNEPDEGLELTSDSGREVDNEASRLVYSRHANVHLLTRNTENQQNDTDEAVGLTSDPGREVDNKASRNTENQQNQPEEAVGLTSDSGREVDNEASRNTENQQNDTDEVVGLTGDPGREVDNEASRLVYSRNTENQQNDTDEAVGLTSDPGREVDNEASRNTENQQNEPDEGLELTSDPGREVDNEASRNTENQQNDTDGVVGLTGDPGREVDNEASRNTENQQNQPEEAVELNSYSDREVDNEANRLVYSSHANVHLLTRNTENQQNDTDEGLELTSDPATQNPDST